MCIFFHVHLSFVITHVFVVVVVGGVVVWFGLVFIKALVLLELLLQKKGHKDM
jgi:hypothetical protein